MLNKTCFVPICYMFLVSTVILILLTHPPIIGDDSPSYINFVSKRPPIYPIFIWLFKWCGSYQFQAVTWAKTIIYGLSLFYARNWLRQHLKISDFLIFIICCVTLITTFRMVLGSESLSVPLFIVTFFIAVECMQEFQYKKLILLSILTGLLVLTRDQFSYFYLSFIGLVLWYFWKKIPIKKIIIGCAILSCSIVITSLISKFYYYAINAPAECSLSLGHQAIIQPLYLADLNAINYFKDPVQREYVKTMLISMKNQQLTSSSIPLFPTTPSDIYTYYIFNYDPIANMSCDKISNMHISADLQNHFLLNVTTTLFLHDFKKNLSFFIWKYVFIFGNIPLFFCVLIVSLAVCYYLFNRKTAPSIEQVFIITGIMIVISNNLLLFLIAYGNIRYLYYNYFIYYCVAALAADRIFFKVDNKF